MRNFCPANFPLASSRVTKRRQIAMWAAGLIAGATSVGITPAANAASKPSSGGQSTTAAESTTGVQTTTSKPYVLGSRTFVIPFTVQSSGGGGRVELMVAKASSVARPPMRWTAAAVGSTDRPEPFSYTAPADGEYWFTTRTVGPGQSTSVDSPVGSGLASGIAANLSAVLKVVVDTTPPVIEATTDCDGDGRIRTDVVFRDTTEITAVDVRYVTNIDQGQWTLVNDQLTSHRTAGRVEFSPAGRWDETAVVITALDAAGNKQSVQKMVKRPRVAAVASPRYAAVPRPSYDASPSPYRGSAVPYRGSAVPVANDKIAARTASSRSSEILPPPATPEQIGLGFAERDAARDIPGAAPETQRPAQKTRRPAREMQDAAPESIAPGLASPDPTRQRGTDDSATDGASPPSRPRTIAEAFRPIDEPSAVPPRRDDAVSVDRPALPRNRSAESAESAERMARETQTLGDSGASMSLPGPDDAPIDAAAIDLRDLDSLMQRIPLRFSDSARFSLEYEVEALGERGVEAIELYGTVDGGKTWTLWGRDPDRETPFDIEVREDGIFGFRIVVVGQSGLASPRPLDGQAPDILVVVDRQTPEVRITGARYGRGDETGSLVIQYDCRDEHLTPRPVTLAFSDSIDGPWTTIAGGLLNDGRYAWPADPNLPRAFYLRLDATDGAGNVGTHVLDRPIDAQGLAPRARIRGFRSL